MISGSSAIGSDWFLNGLAALQRQEIKTQQELSSGYRIQDASDSPAQTPELISLGSRLASAQTYQTNLGRVKAETNAADTALGTGITLLDQARAIALQGASSVTTASDRQILADQIQSIQHQIVSLANTNVEGRYIFGGDRDQSPPYQLDAASPTGVDALTASNSTRVVTNGSGEAVFQSETAATIFDARDSAGVVTASNTFAALQSLVTSLQANDTVGVSASLTSLQSASGWLNQQQAAYGASGQRITQEQSDVASSITDLQVSISGIRDTDVVQAATDLARENTSQSAAFAAQAQVPRKSLFDYLG